MTTNENPAAIRVCAIADIECSRGCGTGECKREQPACRACDAGVCSVHGPEQRMAGVKVGDSQPAAAPIPEDCDVRNILLDVVPGEDGEGQEVYARNVADVERLLSEMGEKLDAVDAAKQPAPAPADERAAKISDYLNAPGMWAQVYCCAVFVRGWPSDMARGAADEAVKEFGDAACKTVADLTHTLDEVLRVD
ncbi:hypothetical protein [Burkholderia thailandensis]|uniref:hypothetical protein n=1 Tax=Burkholderia thailandensis TaxID=57975 RepID=UPI002D764EA8|nr:hypothetical protein [Burkholderia thailandensis]WRS69116.1 hypothetical protein U9S59_20395 [Burkholderia thailandensis]